MTEPRYTSIELWDRVRAMQCRGTQFQSLVRKNRYEIVSLDEYTKEYVIRYESGNTVSVPLRDLFAVYEEVYRLGRMSRRYLRQPANGRRIVGHTRYSHAPGATIYAILPKLDDRILAEEGGHLKVV